MSDKYFSYSNEFGFDLFKTEQEAKDSAEEMISEFQGDVFSGWDQEEVETVCWGKIKQTAEKFNEMTIEQAEEKGISIPEDCDGFCDYQLVNVKE